MYKNGVTVCKIVRKRPLIPCLPQISLDNLRGVEKQYSKTKVSAKTYVNSQLHLNCNIELHVSTSDALNDIQQVSQTSLCSPSKSKTSTYSSSQQVLVSLCGLISITSSREFVQ